MAKLFLHIGRPKTGTSAVQHALRSRDWANLIYPRTGQWPDGAHHLLTLAFDGQTSRGHIAIPPFGKLLDDLKAELAEAPDKDVVISSEHLFSAERTKRFLDMLQSEFGDRISEFEVITVYRDHIELAASAYNQNVKDYVMAEARLPDDYLLGSIDSFAYAPILSELQQLGIEPRLISYHPRANFVARMLAIFGVEDGDVQAENRNSSMRPSLILCMLIANRLAHDTPADDKEMLRDLLPKLRANDVMRAMPVSGMLLFSGEAMDEARRMLADDRAYVATMLGACPEPAEQEKGSRALLTAEQAESLLAFCVDFPGFDARRDEFHRLVYDFV